MRAVNDPPPVSQTTAKLPDGTEYRVWGPPLPLDGHWTLPDDPTGLRTRWLATRSALSEAGRLDSAVRGIADHWATMEAAPRPVPGWARTSNQILLQVGIDAAVVAGMPAGHPRDLSLWPTEPGGRAAVDILLRVIRQSSDLLPAELLRLHSLICPKIKPTPVDGVVDRTIEKDAKGRLRVHPAMIMGSDGVLKEGAAPEQLLRLVIDLLRKNSQARSAGVPSIVRAAWVMHALGVIHPFSDGNGRVGRVFASLILVRGGGFPFILSPVDHGRYLDAVAAARNGRPAGLVGLVAAAQGLAVRSALEYLESPGRMLSH